MSDDKPFDAPLEEVESSTPRGAPVIDFGGVRIAYGLRRFHHQRCEHKSLRYDRSDRRIWCVDCERTIDTFDAFMVVVDYFLKMQLAAEGALRRAKEGEAAVLIRRKSKEIDRHWGRGMAPQCPNCRFGIMPEDNFMGWVSFEYELARRKRDAGK